MSDAAIGRTVHFVGYDQAGPDASRVCRAAIATETFDNEALGLTIFAAHGLYFVDLVDRDDGKPDSTGGTNLCDGLDYEVGTWHFSRRIRPNA